MKSPIVALILLLCGLLLFIPLGKVWLRDYQRKINYRRILKEIDELYAHLNPYQLSKRAREQEKTSPDFLYGEIEICALLDLLALTHPVSKQIFYDLGSGCGKAVLAVKLGYPALNVTGIEYLAALHDIAVQRYEMFLAKYHLSSAAFELNLIQQNFLSHDIQNADIVFINATGYGQATWQQILDKLLQLKPGSKVIVTSKPLPEQYFYKKYQGMELMSWGLTSTYIYEKKN